MRKEEESAADSESTHNIVHFTGIDYSNIKNLQNLPSGFVPKIPLAYPMPNHGETEIIIAAVRLLGHELDDSFTEISKALKSKIPPSAMREMMELCGDGALANADLMAALQALEIPPACDAQSANKQPSGGGQL
jgi:hypothetical protein